MNMQSNNPEHPDDTVWGNTGVVSSLHRLPNGKVRLVFDDVRQMPMLDASGWSHERMYISVEFDQKKFEGLELSKDELVLLAEKLVIRLVALEKGAIPPVGYNVT